MGVGTEEDKRRHPDKQRVLIMGTIIKDTCTNCKKEFERDLDKRNICPNCGVDHTVDFNNSKITEVFAVKVFNSESYKKIFNTNIRNSKELRNYEREKNITCVGDDKSYAPKGQ